MVVLGLRGSVYARRVIDLFDVPWQQLDEDAVQRFLDDSGEEGITWEAKADDTRGVLRPDSLRKAACGLANQLGGYVIVGAKWNSGAGKWTLPGISAPDEEPDLWIGKVLRGLRPVPHHKTKPWTLPGGRVVMVVWIAPVAQTPCMTAQGRIYERVSGETLPVTDPALLARLTQRGEHAQQRALQFADRAAQIATLTPGWAGQAAVATGLALAPIGRQTDDIGARLFTQSFKDELTTALWEFFGKNRQPTDMHVWQRQDSLTVAGTFEAAYEDEFVDAALHQSEFHRSTWLLRASWDGAVTAGIVANDDAATALGSSDPSLRRGWPLLVPLVERLGGYGPTQLTYLFRVAHPSPPGYFDGIPTGTEIRRGVELRKPEPEQIASIERETRRAAGEVAVEPEPDAI